MRLVTAVLIALLILIQYPLWWGGWLRVYALRAELAQQQQKNADDKLRNEQIQGEVQDLQSGTAAVEERARYEMGMIKDGEVFVQFVMPNTLLPAAPLSNTSTRGKVSALPPLKMVPNPAPRVTPNKKRKEEKKSKHPPAKRSRREG